MAVLASLLPLAEQQFTDGSGEPLAAGSVYFYTPGTTTLKTTWADSGQVTPNPNPVTLDANGRAIVYGSGAYRQVVYDAAGNLIWDQVTSSPLTSDQVTQAAGGASPYLQFSDGFFMQLGVATSNSIGVGIVTFPAPFNASSEVFFYATPVGGADYSVTVTVVGRSGAQFATWLNGSPAPDLQFYWQAVGQAAS